VFANYNVPTEYDNVHVTAAFDLLTGLPADNNTPPERIVYKSFTALHSEKPENPNWENPVEDWALKNGYSYPPEGAILSLLGGQGEIDVTISQPSDNSQINQTPFTLSAEAKSSDSISRMDLFIDGQFYQSQNSNPAYFTINSALNNGQHTLAVKAFDTQNKTGSASININFGSLDSLTLKEPAGDSLAVFPLSLSAESGKKFDTVSFYYSGAEGEKLVGSPVSSQNSNGRYLYTFTWSSPPSEKSFSVYARTNTGLETKKVKISVP
jgi:hypothetical protein